MSDSADEQAADDVESDVESDVDSAGAAAEPETDAEGEDAEDEADDAVAATGTTGGYRRWIAVAVLVLGLAGAAFEGWLLYDHHRRSVAAAQALEAAEKYTMVLTGVDPADIDKNFAEVLDGATGEFKDLYAASSEQLRRLLIENKAAAHGTVIDSAVKSATKNRVEVLIFVDQSVSNKAAPKPMIDRSRIAMTMEKVNGRWLAAKVDMP